MVSINTMREPGMERYWIPSIPESALFGTKLTDDTFLISTGGDVAFLTGALKHMIERDLVDHDFMAEHTNGFDEMTVAACGVGELGGAGAVIRRLLPPRCGPSASWWAARRRRSSSGAWASPSTRMARRRSARSSISR